MERHEREERNRQREFALITFQCREWQKRQELRVLCHKKTIWQGKFTNPLDDVARASGKNTKLCIIKE